MSAPRPRPAVAALVRALTRGFRKVHRFDAALRRKLTPAGWFIALVLVASGVFGADTRMSLLYQLFAFSFALLVVAALASWRTRMRVEARRVLPALATVGVPFNYFLHLRNMGRPAGAVEVLDGLAHREPEAAEFLDRSGDEDGLNSFDRFVGYRRWVQQVRRKTGARMQWLPARALEPQREHTLAMRCTPLRRGLLEFTRVHVAEAEPLGLMRRIAVAPRADSLLVLPRTYPVAPPALPGARRLQPGGVAFAGQVGDAGEFLALRDYRAGDSPRRIHWKAWARTGRPVVKEYQEEFFVRHALVLDTFTHAGDARLETAVSVAASFAAAPRSADSLLDLMFVEQHAYTLTMGRGVGSPNELLRVLAMVPASGGDGFGSLTASVLLHASRLSGAIVVLLDWDEERRRLVALLRGRGVPVQVWVVRDAAAARDTELDAGPMAGDPARLRVVTPATVAEELARP